MILLLDTTVLVDVVRKRQGRADFLDALTLEGYQLTTSAISVGEIYGGLRPGEEKRISALLSTLYIYPATELIARQAGLFKGSYARRGVTLGLDDMIIAATALAYDLLLLTDNRRHFPMPELKLFPIP